MATSALPFVVHSKPGTAPEIKTYDDPGSLVAGDFVLLTAGALAIATNTNGAAGILGFVVGSDVPAASDIIPKAGLDSNATGIQRMGATGTSTDKLHVCVLTANDEVELDVVAGAQYANCVVGSTIGIKGASGSSKAYCDTSYTALGVVTKVVKAPTSTVDGRIWMRFNTAILQG